MYNILKIRANNGKEINNIWGKLCKSDVDTNLPLSYSWSSFIFFIHFKLLIPNFLR